MEGSGIAQLVSTNYKDSVLTHKPQVTFFRNPAKQHTPYAIDTIEEYFNEIPNFSDEVFCKLSKSGDLIDSITIKIILSSVQISNATDNLYLSNYTNVPITFNENTLTLDQMITEYETLIGKFMLFQKSSMIYWRGFRKLIQNANSNYNTMISLANSYKTNQNDVLSTYETNNEFSNAKILKDYKGAVIKFNFDILDHILSQYSSDAISIYNTSMTQIFKTKVIKYLDDNIFYQNVFLKQLIDIKTKFTNIHKVTNSKFYRFSWVENIGIALVDELHLEIGGKKFDYQDKITIESHYQHTVKNEHKKTIDSMLGNVKELLIFDDMKKPQYEILLQIPFGHLLYENMSIPTVSAKYQDIVVRLKMSSLDDCCYFEPNYFNNYISNINLEEHVSIINATLLVDYVQLGNIERKKFATKTVESLIEQTRLLTFKQINKKDSMIILELGNVIKDVQWTIQSKYAVQAMKLWNQFKFQYVCFGNIVDKSTNPLFYGKLNVMLQDENINTIIDPLMFVNGICEIYHSKYYNGKYKILYAENGKLIIDNEQLIYTDTFSIKLHPNITFSQSDVENEHIIIYGQALDTPRDASFYTNVGTRNRTHSSIIHKRSIALMVEQLQPSGVLNFNRIKNKHLRIQFNDNVIEYLENNNDTIIVNIIGKSYNTSISENGYITLAYGY